MKKINKKGVGLVVAIMITTVLMIMASGFFVVTRHMTNTAQSELEKLRLYWAAESGSNYSINWWVNQDVLTRVAWPYFYDPDGEAKLFSGNNKPKPTGGDDLKGGNGGGNNDDVPPPEDWNDYDLTDGTDAEGSTDNSWMQEVDENLHDANGYLAAFNTSDIPGYLPPVCDGIATDNKLYLHSSSEKISMQYPDSEDSYTIYLLRYKGERIDKENTSVWVMDTWAVDDQTGETYRIMMSNLYNFIPTNTEWLQYNEAMVHTQYALSNARKGVYTDSDYRFGQSYYAEPIRFDYKTNQSTGPRFYGKIKSSAISLSKYGNVGLGGGNLFTQDVEFKQGLMAEMLSNINESDAIDLVTGSVLAGWEKVNPMPLDNIVWSWDEVEENSSLTPNGIFMLSEAEIPVGEIKIVLSTSDTSGEVLTTATVTGGGVTKEYSVSESGINAIAVPTEYGTVSIEGNSSDNFSLITEEDIVKITDHLYLTEMEDVVNTIGSLPNVDAPTMANMTYIYETMYNKYPDSHLSVLSGIALTPTGIDEYGGVPALGDRENQIDLSDLRTVDYLFSTCGYYLGYGDIGTPPGGGNGSINFYNVGSMILNAQAEKTGTNSFKGIMAYVQDKRFYDEDFVGGVGWGSGPGDDSDPIKGLNDRYRWTGGYAGINAITESNFEYLVSAR
jgi:hypothetical protein